MTIGQFLLVVFLLFLFVCMAMAKIEKLFELYEEGKRNG